VVLFGQLYWRGAFRVARIGVRRSYVAGGSRMGTPGKVLPYRSTPCSSHRPPLLRKIPLLAKRKKLPHGDRAKQGETLVMTADITGILRVFVVPDPFRVLSVVLRDRGSSSRCALLDPRLLHGTPSGCAEEADPFGVHSAVLRDRGSSSRCALLEPWLLHGTPSGCFEREIASRAVEREIATQADVHTFVRLPSTPKGCGRIAGGRGAQRRRPPVYE